MLHFRRMHPHTKGSIERDRPNGGSISSLWGGQGLGVESVNDGMAVDLRTFITNVAQVEPNSRSDSEKVLLPRVRTFIVNLQELFKADLAPVNASLLDCGIMGVAPRFRKRLVSGETSELCLDLTESPDSLLNQKQISA